MMSVHNSKEWKLKADAFKEGKVCEWCGADNYLHVHHPFGSETHQKHILNRAYFIFKGEYKKRYPRKRVVDHTKKVRYLPNKNAPDFKKEFIKWKAEHGIDAVLKQAHEKYLSLEGCIVLCRKCHFAAEHGKDLCPICKTKYKSKRYDSCFDCIPKETKEKIITWKQREKELNTDVWDCESFEETGHLSETDPKKYEAWEAALTATNGHIRYEEFCKTYALVSNTKISGRSDP